MAKFRGYGSGTGRIQVEWSGFEEAVKGKSQIIGIRIRENSAFKLYRNFSYCVPRGTMLQYDEMKALLWTKGFIPRFRKVNRAIARHARRVDRTMNHAGKFKDPGFDFV